MLLLITIVDYFKKIVVQYKLDKDKVPSYYVNENGGLYAKSDEVFYHPKVQEDLKHYINIKRVE